MQLPFPTYQPCFLDSNWAGVASSSEYLSNGVGHGTGKASLEQHQ